MIYFTQTGLTRWVAKSHHQNEITGERYSVLHAVINETLCDEEFTILWKCVGLTTRKMTTHHHGDLTGAQGKILKAREHLGLNV